MATSKGSQIAASLGRAVNEKIATIRSVFSSGVCVIAHEEGPTVFSITIESGCVIEEWQKVVLRDFLLSDEIRAIIQAHIKRNGWRAFRSSTRPISAKHPSRKYVRLVKKVKV